MRDVYTGSRMQGQKDPGSGSASKNWSIFNQKNFPSSRKTDFGMVLLWSWFFSFPGSRIQGSKRHRIPDPDRQPCLQAFLLLDKLFPFQICHHLHNLNTSSLLQIPLFQRSGTDWTTRHRRCWSIKSLWGEAPFRLPVLAHPHSPSFRRTFSNINNVCFLCSVADPDRHWILRKPDPDLHESKKQDLYMVTDLHHFDGEQDPDQHKIEA